MDYQNFHRLHDSGGETGGSKTPVSQTFYYRFPAPSVGVSVFLFYFYCKMLHNIAKFFSIFPVPATSGIPLPALCPPASRTSPAPYSSGLPPCPPSHDTCPRFLSKPSRALRGEHLGKFTQFTALIFLVYMAVISRTTKRNKSTLSKIGTLF